MVRRSIWRRNVCWSVSNLCFDHPADREDWITSKFGWERWLFADSIYCLVFSDSNKEKTLQAGADWRTPVSGAGVKTRNHQDSPMCILGNCERDYCDSWGSPFHSHEQNLKRFGVSILDPLFIFLGPDRTLKCQGLLEWLTPDLYELLCGGNNVCRVGYSIQGQVKGVVSGVSLGSKPCHREVNMLFLSDFADVTRPRRPGGCVFMKKCIGSNDNLAGTSIHNYSGAFDTSGNGDDQSGRHGIASQVTDIPSAPHLVLYIVGDKVIRLH